MWDLKVKKRELIEMKGRRMAPRGLGQIRRMAKGHNLLVTKRIRI